MNNKYINIWQDINIIELKNAFKKGNNVTQYLKEKLGVKYNTTEIIELAYDLQAGSYQEFVKKNKVAFNFFMAEVSSIMSNYVTSGFTLLDAGCGELTSLSAIVKILKNKPKKVFAYDLSWSRIYSGLKYMRNTLKDEYNIVSPFVAYTQEIPLPSKSIDVTMSIHSLEPNGKQLDILLEELFRVTKSILILTEPSYELNSQKNKARMEKLGYIKNIPSEVKKLGGKIIEMIPIKNSMNKNNLSAAYIIEPSKSTIFIKKPKLINFSFPGTDNKMKKIDNFYFSKDYSSSFPILKNIPILKTKNIIVNTIF